MTLRRTILCTAIATLPFMLGAASQAATPLMAAPSSMPSPQAAKALAAAMVAQGASQGLDGDHGVQLAAQHPGVSGTTVYRFDHTYKNLRIWQSESVVVTGPTGAIVAVSEADRRHSLGGGAALKAGAPAFDVAPKLSSERAIALAIGSIAPYAQYRSAPSAELLIYPIMKTVRRAAAAGKSEAALNALDLEEKLDGYELAYLVKTRMLNAGKPVYHDTLISAVDGRILQQWSALTTVLGSGKSEYSGTVALNTSFNNGMYQLIDTTRGVGGSFGGMAVVNANHGSGASVFSSAVNTWGDGLHYNGGSTSNANGQTAGVDAMFGLATTYDLFKNALGWHGLDGANTAVHILVHVGSNVNNAYYDDSCKCMNIGDGDATYTPDALDVIGHELMHGVTAATSNLGYSGEAGGLNESSSDIAGEMVESYGRSGAAGSVIGSANDWKVGGQIGPTALRFMYKPSKDGQSPDAWSSTLRNLDVHLASGPNNRMFYFLSQGSSSDPSSDYYSRYLTSTPLAMTGIGNDKAYRIWFKAATTKFTASTNYADARSKMIAAAQELYGMNSAEALAVQRAYAAINVGTDIVCECAPLGFTAVPVNTTAISSNPVVFSVTPNGGTAPYTYRWYRNGSLISGANASSYSFTTQLADSGAVFYVNVTDSSAQPMSATTPGATLTVLPNLGPDALVNGDFDAGTTPWRGSTASIGTFSAQKAYNGTRNAWLGGNGRSTTESLAQTITIPATATSAQLNFYLHIDTAETGSTAYDKLVVTVKNSAGSVLRTLASYSNANAAAGYQQRNFDLSAYKGQTVQISFVATEDSSLQSSFVLDAVHVILH
ncbi:MAG: M4 family metallopeptidase [Pseudomonadota bacterium]